MNTTPSTDRHEAARAALAAHDDGLTELVGDDGHQLRGSLERAEYVIRALRAVVEAPAPVEPAADEIADGLIRSRLLGSPETVAAASALEDRTFDASVAASYLLETAILSGGIDSFEIRALLIEAVRAGIESTQR